MVVSARNPIFSSNNSNRSSMDVSTCSYNTLIIHNDDSMYPGAADYGGNASSTTTTKKDRPRSFGTGTDQVIKEILETPDYNQNSVLKQLVKEMKLPSSHHVESGEPANRPPPKYNHGDEQEKSKKTTVHDVDEEYEDDEGDEDEDEESGDQTLKLKSKSQPDLSRIIDIDLETIEALMKDNMLLKEQLNHCYKKVAKTKKVRQRGLQITMQ